MGVNLTKKQTALIQQQEAQNLVYRWIKWLYTRRYYNAPLPANILARLSGSHITSSETPDAKNDALCCAFNHILELARMEEAEKPYSQSKFIPFIYIYLSEYRPLHNPSQPPSRENMPIKIPALAIDMGINVDTVYQRAHSAARQYMRDARQWQQISAMMQREVAG